MTGRKKVHSEPIEANSLQDAIAKLQALKQRREAANTDILPADAPKKRGRPAKAAPEQAEQAAPNRAEKDRPAASSSAGVRKRRTSTPSPLSADSPPPSFGVSKLTAHKPLGLLEVQEKADLDALLADPRLAGMIAMRLDDHFALVLPAHLERLQAALLKVGHTPKLVGNRA